MGAMLRGVVVVPIDESASLKLVRQIAQEVKPTLLIHGSEQDVADLKMRKCSIYALSEEDSIEEVQKTFTPTHLDDPALIIYTSGTTQNPKGVILTHKNILTQVENFKRWHWLVRWVPIRLLGLSPLSHIQGLMLGAMIPLSIGLSVLYSDSVEPHHVIRTIRQNRITVLLAVPRVQHVLADNLRNHPSGRKGEALAKRMSKVRFFPLRRHFLFLATHARLGYSFWVLLVGGANLPPADERFWYECGYVLVQGYGLTETAALVSLKINSPFFAHLGSIGKPIGQLEVRLNEDGEVLVKGENVSPGYFQNQTADQSGFHKGYLRTGDLLSQDRQKRLYFVGRKKEAIVTGEGHNVYPQDVEKVLLQQPGVHDAVVVGLTEDGITEVHPVLLVGDDVEPGQVIRNANQILEAHQMIRSWTIWPERDFPRTSLLKVRRKLVAAHVQKLRADQQEMNSQVGMDLSLEKIKVTSDRRQRIELLARYVKHGSLEEKFTRNLQVVEAFGLSSLDVVELRALLERGQSESLSHLTLLPQSSLADIRASLHVSPAQWQPNPLPEQQPAWSNTSLGRLIRSVTQPALIGLWENFSAKINTIWEMDQRKFQMPYMIAAAPHRNWLDGFVVYAGLPARGRKRLVTVTNRDFAEIFNPLPDTPLRTQIDVGLAYYLLWPLVFDFVIVPNFGSTRTGLHHLGKYIEKGYSPITFPKGLAPPGRENLRHEPGMAMMALQTGLPILPIWIQGNDHLQISPQRMPDRLTVRIGKPVPVHPNMTSNQVVTEVEKRFQNLGDMAGETR
jgi:long-chain acyl-CoA synthetase